MTPESSLPCTQDSVTGCCLEPDESSLQLPILFLSKLHYNILGFQVASPLQVFWPALFIQHL